MAKEGKRLKEARKLVEEEKVYSLEEASEIISKFPKAKFDESKGGGECSWNCSSSSWHRKEQASGCFL